ncbi:MAG: FtsH protease activity modulator HflK [Pseudomonadota bacterium]
MSAERRLGSAELRRFSDPLLKSLEIGLGYLRWALGGLAVLYLLSGLIIVGSDEVAVVLRFGALAGGSPATAVLSSGLHYTLPRPIDQVLRVKVQKVYELEVYDLHYRRPGQGEVDRSRRRTIDPVVEGYALTGDHNVVQVDMVARYQISDPVAWALYQAQPEALLRDAVMAAAVRTMGEVEVDSVLSEGRAPFVIQVVQRAQERLDRVGVGISLVSLEVTELTPPRQVLDEFKQVQNAFIDKETQVKEAQKLREEELPLAQATRDQAIREAQGYAAQTLATARGEAQKYLDLVAEYRKNPKVVRERLYREGIESALPQADRLRFVPPPSNGHHYQVPDGFRISVPAKQQ